MVRTRFSPSPTGLIHIGNARAALFSALYAAKEKGVFLLRIEDTDLARSEQKYTELLQEDLHWLGLTWQEGPGVGGPYQPYWQSQRHDLYYRYYTELENRKLVYPCFCTDQELALNRKLQLSRGQAPRYPGTCQRLSQEDITNKLKKGLKPALRFRVPAKKTIEFVDLVKGSQRFNSDDMGDFIVRRQEGTASFLFCNAIDDSLMEVTHVLRGDDHLANTPRQLMLLEALDMRAPQYGYLSIAVLNYMARLSHTYELQSLMNFKELADYFKLEKLSRSPARFDKNQLLHWQKESVIALDTRATLDWLGVEIMEKVPEEN